MAEIDRDPTTPEIAYKQEVRRKLVHLSSLWIVASLWLLPRGLNVGLFALLSAGTLFVEYAYSRKIQPWRDLYGRFFGAMLRSEPKPGTWIVSGGPYVLLAAFICALLFESIAAGGAVLVMLIGDTLAALIGRRFGKHKTFNNKSIEGVVAFVLGSYAALVIYLLVRTMDIGYIYWAIPAVLLAAAAELFEKQLRIDDNFSIPVIVGIFLSIPEWLRILGC